MKISQISTCKYCNEPVKLAQKRCKECGSWLGFKPYLGYPETWIIIIGLVVSILAALFAWKESYDTYLERQKVENLKSKTKFIADNVKFERQKVEEIKTELQKDMNAFRMELKNKNWE